MRVLACRGWRRWRLGTYFGPAGCVAGAPGRDLARRASAHGPPVTSHAPPPRAVEGLVAAAPRRASSRRTSARGPPVARALRRVSMSTGPRLRAPCWRVTASRARAAPAGTLRRPAPRAHSPRPQPTDPTSSVSASVCFLPAPPPPSASSAVSALSAPRKLRRLGASAVLLRGCPSERAAAFVGVAAFAGCSFAAGAAFRRADALPSSRGRRRGGLSQAPRCPPRPGDAIAGTCAPAAGLDPHERRADGAYLRPPCLERHLRRHRAPAERGSDGRHGRLVRHHLDHLLVPATRSPS
jgi:hypothetical protein